MKWKKGRRSIWLLVTTTTRALTSTRFRRVMTWILLFILEKSRKNKHMASSFSRQHSIQFHILPMSTAIFFTCMSSTLNSRKKRWLAISNVCFFCFTVFFRPTIDFHSLVCVLLRCGSSAFFVEHDSICVTVCRRACDFYRRTPGKKAVV